MTQLIYDTTSEVDVKKTFNILIIKYGMDKDTALAEMNQNEIAVANADAWYVEIQSQVSVADSWQAGIWATRGWTYLYLDVNYTCIQSHQTQAGWEPPSVPALFNPVPIQYPGENYPRWKQPLGSEDAYKIDDRVTHKSKDYRSKVNANVWEPPEQWTQLGGGTPAYPEWKQPTGAHDDYDMGARVAHNSQNWESTVNGNVWEPGVYGWITI